MRWCTCRAGSDWDLNGTLALSSFAAYASNPFPSNTVALTPQNWKEEVLESPHGVRILHASSTEWEKLARSVKGQVKVAYWDTKQRGRPPALLGKIEGTPTIRFFKPKKKQKSNADKVCDGLQSREKS
eukprot:scaffold13311_cov161-Cylindrotheca_fusiformis.AAC.5